MQSAGEMAPDYTNLVAVESGINKDLQIVFVTTRSQGMYVSASTTCENSTILTSGPISNSLLSLNWPHLISALRRSESFWSASLCEGGTT
eukprot:753290-Hanusia_phi.AAC.9